MLRIGTLLYGYCGGVFDRNSTEDKRVEGIGADWVVARDTFGNVRFYSGNPEDLMEYTSPERWP